MSCELRCCWLVVGIFEPLSLPLGYNCAMALAEFLSRSCESMTPLDELALCKGPSGVLAGPSLLFPVMSLFFLPMPPELLARRWVLTGAGAPTPAKSPPRVWANRLLSKSSLCVYWMSKSSRLWLLYCYSPSTAASRMAFFFARDFSASLVAGRNFRLPLLLNCSESAELRCWRTSRLSNEAPSFSP